MSAEATGVLSLLLSTNKRKKISKRKKAQKDGVSSLEQMDALRHRHTRMKERGIDAQLSCDLRDGKNLI